MISQGHLDDLLALVKEKQALLRGQHCRQEDRVELDCLDQRDNVKLVP